MQQEMYKKDRKRSFKTKVIAKLFGQVDEDDYIQDEPSDSEVNVIDTTGTSSHLSKLHAPNAKVYGVYYCPTEQKQDNAININEFASVSPASDDDDDSESFLVRKKRKRRGRHGHSKSVIKEQHPTLSSTDSPQTNGSPCHTNSPISVTCSNLTKNQKRKLKKKQKERKKKVQSSSSMEFTFVQPGPAYG